MTTDEAQEIVRRFGEKHALVILLDRRIAELTTQRNNTMLDIDKAKLHAASAMAHLSDSPRSDPSVGSDGGG